MRRTIYLSILLGVFVAACSGSSPGDSNVSKKPPSPPSNPSTPSTPPTGNLTVSDPSGGAGPFAIASVDRMVIAVDIAHFQPGQHAVRVDVTAPSGTLYAQLPAALVVASDGTGHVTTTLQVHGSLIESYHDVGNWQFIASVDGAPVASASVDIAQ